MIGLTLKYKTLAGISSGSAEESFVNAYGGLDKALAALREMGIRSVEISFLPSAAPHAVTLRMIRNIYDHGMQASLHGVLEDLSADAYFAAMRPIFTEIFRHQSALSITLHGSVDLDMTKRITQDWSAKAALLWPGISFAVENQRVKNLNAPHEKDHFRIDAIPATLPQQENAGICWDMGHYAYNVVNMGLPAETLPRESTLKLVRHTHIHSLRDLDTHHPIAEHPIREYIDALRSVGYRGIYNIEVKPDKYIAYMDVREGMESSIALIRRVLGE